MFLCDPGGGGEGAEEMHGPARVWDVFTHVRSRRDQTHCNLEMCHSERGECVRKCVCTFSFLFFSLSCMHLAADGPELSHVNQEIIKENTRKIHFHSRPSREIELAPSHYDDCVHRLYVNATSSSLACTF